MSRSRIETFNDQVNKDRYRAAEVLWQIPDYRARQAKHIKQIVADQGHGSKRLIPVCEALISLPGLVRRAKSIIGEEATERILAEAEERLAMQNVIK